MPISPRLLVLLFLVLLPAVTTRIYASDEVQYFAIRNAKTPVHACRR